MGFGQQFGLESPLVLDLSIVKITFALMFKINIASNKIGANNEQEGIVNFDNKNKRITICRKTI